MSFADKASIMFYHLRSGLDPSELAKADVVQDDGTLRPCGTRPGPDLLLQIDEVVHWWISDWDHNDISFAGIFELYWDSPFPRFAFMEGGCDYTGWGCQSGASIVFASSMEQLVRWGLGDEDRQRWNIDLR